jgi:AcrR family transcriptional regulator
MEAIRKKLKTEAEKFAITTGMDKTSLDKIVAAAGISKPTFYRLFESKEHLFLELTNDWHREMVDVALSIIQDRTELSMKERLVQCFMHTLRYMDQRSMSKLLTEDIPQLYRKIPGSFDESFKQQEALLLPIMKTPGIRFKVDFEIVSALVCTITWTLAGKDDIGPRYFDAAELLIRSFIGDIVED